MKNWLVAIAVTAALQASVAAACSCGRPEELSEWQLRFAMKNLSLIARGRVIAVRYPLGCRIAPLRWAYTLANARLPVTYTIAVRETLWGRPVAVTNVVQRQNAGWDACKPLGSVSCEPTMPTHDALWVLNRMPNGEQRDGGRCGQMLAPAFIRLGKSGGDPAQRWTSGCGA